jgi:flagellar protein FliS
MNASPIDLRLMLLDGLIRRIDEAGVALHDAQTAVALEAFAKARAIAEELESGISEDGGSDLATQMRNLYAYLHRLLVEARVERCHTRLDEARKLAEFEYETWSMLNHRLIDGGESATNRIA